MSNILNKSGLLTDEDVKEPFEYGGMHFTFKTNMDLSIPIKVIAYGRDGATYTLNQYSSDVANFTCYWTNVVMKKLNGFSGFYHVKFELVNFKIA